MLPIHLASALAIALSPQAGGTAPPKAPPAPARPAPVTAPAAPPATPKTPPTPATPAPAAPPVAPAPSAAPAATVAHTIDPSAARTNEALAKAVQALRDANPQRVTVRDIGRSAAGTPIQALVLSNDAAAADSRPGILVVAGLDGPRWFTTEAALVLAENLATERSALLEGVTVFVVPRANPDAASAFLAGPRRDYSGNAIKHDNDRDHRMDENPPQDLNGDGAITVIRAKNLVAPYANPTLVADTADPRLMRAPDPLKGEVAIYTVFVEGVDTDGDSRISEDGPGGVVPDRNFPHRWPEFEDEAGAFPLVAPEADALAQFVLTHPTLAGAFVMGRIDTVVNVPDGKARAEGGTPMIITEEDAKAYGPMAKIYRDLLGQTRASEMDTSGSFIAWMNAQRGVPTFGAQLWGRPDAPAKPADAAKPGDAPAAKPGDAGAAKPAEAAPAKPAEPAAQAEPTPPAGAPRQAGGNAPQGQPGGGGAPGAGPRGGGPGGGGGGRGGRGGRGQAPRAEPTANEKVEAANPDDAAWLALSDSQGGAGFLPWTTIQHPQLGEVEIGGWIPGWRENPPLDQVRPLGEKSAAFVAALAEHRAQVDLGEPRVTMLAPGLYQVEATLANKGQLPTIEQGGRTGDVTPAHVLRISTPVDRIKSGQRMSIVRGLTPGEARRMQWVVAAAPEEVIELELLFVGKPVTKFTIRNGEVGK